MFLISFSILLFSVIGINNVNASDEMTIGVSVLGYEGDYIRIQVPDYIFLGDISKDDATSNEVNVRVNNTGTLDAIVTPQLVSGSNPIFNYTFFRLQKTQNNTAVPFKQIGNFNFNVDKKNDETFYISMNLSNYEDEWPTENLNLNATIRFNAMAAE